MTGLKRGGKRKNSAIRGYGERKRKAKRRKEKKIEIDILDLDQVREPGKNNKKLWIALTVLGCFLFAAGGIAVKVGMDSRKEALEAVRLESEEAVAASEKLKEEKKQRQMDDQSELLGYSMESGQNVFEAIKKRPPSMELTDENTAEFAQVVSCVTDSGSGGIRLKMTADALPESDDKFYYLFSIRSYESGLSADNTSYLAQEYKGTEVEFRLPRRYTTRDMLVFGKLVVAVKKDGKYVAVSRPSFITNPEEQAKFSVSGPAPASKKGLLVDPNKLRSGEWKELGVQHAAYNIMLSRILGTSTDGIHPTINYTYNGQTYLFNGQVMSEYDLVFSTLTQRGISATAIILNDVSGMYPQLIHPQARSGIGSAPYYAFNGSDESGTGCLAAVGAFLAERYSDSEHGVVTNWIIGNEINARKEWNYMEYVGLESYVAEYAKAFRIFYNAIKTVNAEASVYISLDQQWDRNLKGSKNYDSRDVLDEFNRQIKAEGNIDWGLAIHPYNVPLTNVKTWASSKYVKNSPDTSMVTMDNIEVVTDYLEQETFLTNAGEVRSVTLSELGYTSGKGEEIQAAAIVYAYKKAAANPHIDSILFSRETDALEEVAQGLALGLNRTDGSHKYAWNVYKNMDTGNKEEYTDFAKGIIGISNWSEIQ